MCTLLFVCTHNFSTRDFTISFVLLAHRCLLFSSFSPSSDYHHLSVITFTIESSAIALEPASGPGQSLWLVEIGSP